jgi:methyl-accepting chemotaxis protein
MTALQPLTDQQVQNRLDAYNPGGALERDIRALWDAAGDIIEAEVAEQFGDDAASRVRTHYTSRVDADWIQSVAEYGRRLFAEKSSVPAYIASRDQLISRILGRMFERFAAEPDRLLECTLAFQRLTAYETDIILAQVALLEADDAAEQRGEQTKAFERKVTELVGKGVSQSEALIKHTSSTAASARGMLGKTSEVAAAAEQSATAMREAAQTAAGLIRAIEDARSEVEVAAGVATRAGDQAEAAVKVSQALSAHVEAIESILGLIRDIAGRPTCSRSMRLIEAARAGDAGRGFALSPKK